MLDISGEGSTLGIPHGKLWKLGGGILVTKITEGGIRDLYRWLLFPEICCC